SDLYSGRSRHPVAEDDIIEALRASEQRYRTLFEQAPIGVFIYDKTLHILECNARFVSILESTMDRLVGLDMTTLRDQRAVGPIARALEGDTTYYSGPYAATTGPARLWISMRMSPLRNGHGGVVAGMGIVEDITEQKLREEALKRSETRFRTVVEFSPDLVGV